MLYVAFKNITYLQWCLAINNIDHIKRSICPFVDDLGLTELMENLAYFKSDIDADRCKKTLKLVVDNAIDTVNNKIVDLLQIIVNHVSYHNIFLL